MRITPMKQWLLFLLIVMIVVQPIPALSATPNEATIESLLSEPQANLGKIQAFGRDVVPVLVRVYKRSDEDRRAVIAWIFYNLGWQSEVARRALMQDVHTDHQALRLQVQWALGRVSRDPAVVDTLLSNLRNDANPLFRDKAACALAYDQIHLNEKEKVRVLEGLIAALSDENPQIRSVSIKALKIHTGQTKGFRPNASVTERQDSLQRWESWLEEYHANL